MQFTTTEGRDIWINPIHVKAVRAKTGLLGGKKNASEIWLGWSTTSQSIDIAMSPPEVVNLLNASTPSSLLPAFLESDDENNTPKNDG